jgi:ABC-type multidrug transport system fused ATPase/permease subunit
VRNIARALGDEISEEKHCSIPALGWFPSGCHYSALFCWWSPSASCSALASLTPDLLKHLRDAVEQRHNILISGGTRSGKTTLLTALAAFISDHDRVVLIENACEIQITKINRVRS